LFIYSKDTETTDTSLIFQEHISGLGIYPLPLQKQGGENSTLLNISTLLSQA